MPETPLSILLSPQTLTQISDYHLLAKTAVEGLLTGLHRSLCRGSGSEFMQYRAYTPGDDLKFLDWKLLARLGKPYSKVYHEETNLRCAIILDASASMAYQGKDAPCSKFRYAALLAACLAYLAYHQGDQVGLFAYGSEMQCLLPPGESSGGLARVLAALENCRPSGRAEHGAAWQQVNEMLPRRSMLVWLSDFHEFESQLGRTLQQFRFAGHDCLACQILDQDELTLPFQETLSFIDSESNQEITTTVHLVREKYRQRMQDFLDSTRRQCLDTRTDYLLASTSDNLGYLLAAWLHKREALHRC
ncbi:MAG: DUF58 domain-containing protein [Lentisphaerae bacterium]|nr:DUF58 domain-containing protein [Lentisphaerota bacterium]